MCCTRRNNINSFSVGGKSFLLVLISFIKLFFYFCWNVLTAKIKLHVNSSANFYSIVNRWLVYDWIILSKRKFRHALHGDLECCARQYYLVFLCYVPCTVSLLPSMPIICGHFPWHSPLLIWKKIYRLPFFFSAVWDKC